MAYSDIPAGPNRDYYLSGRGRALYQLVFPAPAEPPRGTPAWWSNEGIIDAWMGRPSRIGVEATLTDADGKPLPVRIGVPDPNTGEVPRGPFDGAPAPAGNPGQPPAQPKGPVVIPRWATDYWTAYLIARQDPATANTRLGQGSTWTAYYRKGLADGLAGNAPIDPSGFVPSASQLAEVQSILGTSGGSGGQVRQAPKYTPRGNGSGGVYIPPPPGPAIITTREIYGTLRGRRMPVFDLLKKDGLRSHIKDGGRVLIGDTPSEGYGYGGTPGAWAQASGGASPAAFGLDPNVGVVAWDGRKLRPVEAYTLEALFGPGWRAIVQAG